MNRSSSIALSSCSRRCPRLDPHPIRHRAMADPETFRIPGFYRGPPSLGQILNGRPRPGEVGGDIQATTKAVDCRSLTSSPPKLTGFNAPRPFAAPSPTPPAADRGGRHRTRTRACAPHAAGGSRFAHSSIASVDETRLSSQCFPQAAACAGDETHSVGWSDLVKDR
jgi:hypothetical protein